MAKDFSKAFYNSLQWKKIRAFVLTRDFYMCKVCGAPHAKTVHHIRELTPMNIGDASISMNTDNLITVCGAARVHGAAMVTHQNVSKKAEEIKNWRKPPGLRENLI